MVGNPLLHRTLSGAGGVRRGAQNSVVAAVDIAAFTDVDGFREDVDSTIEAIKGLPTADGFDEILVPGEPEDRVYLQRLAKGIPLPAGTVRNLQMVAAKLGVALPAELS